MARKGHKRNRRGIKGLRPGLGKQGNRRVTLELWPVLCKEEDLGKEANRRGNRGPLQCHKEGNSRGNKAGPWRR